MNSLHNNGLVSLWRLYFALLSSESLSSIKGLGSNGGRSQLSSESSSSSSSSKGGVSIKGIGSNAGRLSIEWSSSSSSRTRWLTLIPFRYARWLTLIPFRYVVTKSHSGLLVERLGIRLGIGTNAGIPSYPLLLSSWMDCLSHILLVLLRRWFV